MIVSLSFCLQMKTRACYRTSMIRVEVCGKHAYNMKWSTELCIYQTSDFKSDLNPEPL